MEIPVEGYPFSAEAVTTWFRDRHGRDPADAELNAIINAMAARQATAPHEGPGAEAKGWETGQGAPPATRRD